MMCTFFRFFPFPAAARKAVLSVIGAFSIVNITQAGDITEGVLFYAPLDEGVTRARLAEGDPAIASEGASPAGGKIAGAMNSGKKGLVWQQAGNFRRDRGTVAFWFRLPPLEAGAEEPERIILFEAGSFLLTMEPVARRYFS